MKTPPTFHLGSVVKITLGEPFAEAVEPQLAIALGHFSRSANEDFTLLPFLLLVEGGQSLTVWRSAEAVTEVVGYLAALPDGSGVTTKPSTVEPKSASYDEFSEPFTDVRGDDRERHEDPYWDDLSVAERDALRNQRLSDSV